MFDGNMGTALQLKHALSSIEMLNTERGQRGKIEIFNSKSEAYINKSYDLLGLMREDL